MTHEVRATEYGWNQYRLIDAGFRLTASGWEFGQEPLACSMEREVKAVIAEDILELRKRIDALAIYIEAYWIRSFP